MKKKIDWAYVIVGCAFAVIFGALCALFYNWVASLFIDWPVTWGNWGKTWLLLICFNLLSGRVRRAWNEIKD